MVSIEEKIVGILNNYPEVTFALLFGSTATGRAKKESDIDIAIAAKDLLGVQKMVDIQLALSRMLQKEVDLLDIHSLNGIILQEIFKNGRIIIKKDTSLYAKLLRKLWYQHADILPNIRHIIRTQAKRFANEQ